MPGTALRPQGYTRSCRPRSTGLSDERDDPWIGKEVTSTPVRTGGAECLHHVDDWQW